MTRLFGMPVWVMIALSAVLAGCGSSSDGDGVASYNNRMTGTYRIQQIGLNATGFYTSQVEITSAGNGTGTFTILSHSQGGSASNVPFTYVVNMDNSFAVTHSSVTDYGILSSDRFQFLVLDAEEPAADPDGEIILSIGQQTGCSAPPTLGGDYELGQITLDVSGLSPVLITSRINLNFGLIPGTGTYAIVGDSGGATGNNGDFTYTVNPDCTIVVNGVYQGVVSPDGSIFSMVDTNPADDSRILMAIAIKKSSLQTNALLNGVYWFGQYEEDLSGLVPVDNTLQADATMFGDGSGSVTLVRNSAGLPPVITPFSITYAVNADGTFSTTATDTVNGIATENGNIMLVVDTDPTGVSQNIKFGAGIRKQ